jgi:tetratricopeptide (TPR) repeat protein
MEFPLTQTPTYADLWGWYDEVRQSAIQTSNEPILRAMDLHNEGWRNRERDPQHTLSLWNEAKLLARVAGNAWLALYYGYWCCEALTFYLDDTKVGLDEAVKLVVEASKPEYRQCPVLGRVYRMLIDAYSLTDVLGYENSIREMLTYIAESIPVDVDTHSLLVAHQLVLATETGDLKGAFEWANRYLEVSEHSDFRKTTAHLTMCQLHHLRGQYAQALAYAQTAEMSAQRSRRVASRAVAFAWQALILHEMGKVEESHLLFQRATSVRAGLGTKPSGTYYDVLSKYHERRGETEIALQLRERAVNEVCGTGQFYGECKARLLYACLLGRLGQPMDTALASTREATKLLIAPHKFLPKIEMVERGIYDEKILWGLVD